MGHRFYRPNRAQAYYEGRPDGLRGMVSRHALLQAAACVVCLGLEKKDWQVDPMLIGITRVILSGGRFTPKCL